MAHTAPVDLDDLATLAGACNIAHAPDAEDIAALHVRTLTTTASSFIPAPQLNRVLVFRRPSSPAACTTSPRPTAQE
jgi:hypothetical protein